MGTNQFAKLLKYYLNLNGKTQSDMVNALGYDKSTVSGWCSGARVPKLDTIIDIANYLHVEPGDLIVEVDSKPSYYFDEETAQKAQEIFENKQLSLLFDAARDAKPEDLEIVQSMLLALKNKDNK
ncbi:XRE family transcriptional regulator [Coprococcus sp. AF19-8AC]|jgi:transcriptional regulator with XRE-family HTH domain|uniref:helix-turn-helix domain-containing protein n=1 Tax=Coprococcus sp. AF19-8AC TaxID=2293090 RepID=UPI000E7200D3|nr:helix-turn-helix transcriptional regulator [Coprococcus sp. AF19-8AC]RJV45989.1 XRE family transcriptional regulator [Coprococcus sp. AF19-8AC]DAR29074.1 MAG TPA: helix-turn-helix domain protein [Caudoviricetes sp.]